MEDWLLRWKEGRIGWHEAEGSAALREFWPGIAEGARVLVPLCGKSPDMLWLAEQGAEVTGVELSEIAVRAFFEENQLSYEVQDYGGQHLYRSISPRINIVCGDYFKFSDQPFDALYDRASLIALPPQIRPAYVRHTKSLLTENACQLLVTLEYDDRKVGGPPFSVKASEVHEYWGDIQRVAERNDIDDSPPKFRKAGLDTVIEAVWVSR